ncbi:hypothetical protein [Sinomicrobium pectinilyticum]|nr:hypothetical protein [Sinomicrobium pectinilyticum]
MKTDRQMHRKLIELAFEKAEEDLKKKGTSDHSKKKKAKRLSEVILEYENYLYSDRSLVNLYRNLVELEKEDEFIKQSEVILALCKYLGYPDYESFQKDRQNEIFKPKEQSKNPLFRIFRHRKLVLVIGVSIAFILIWVLSFQVFMPKQQWMEWQENHYTEVNYNAQKLRNGTLKLYKEERILYFKKIEPDCNTDFFTDKGIENLWYGKNEKGELEFFTDQGLHPETGKTLKAITPYMIRKYICEDY